jgi:hypothetical protein
MTIKKYAEVLLSRRIGSWSQEAGVRSLELEVWRLRTIVGLLQITVGAKIPAVLTPVSRLITPG